MPFLTASQILALSVGIGILIPPLAAAFRPFVFYALFFLMLAVLLQIDLRSTFASILSDTRRVGYFCLVQMALIPIVMLVLYLGFSPSGEWALYVFYAACAGAIFGTPAFARLSGLDPDLALKGVVASNLLMPLTLIALAPLAGESRVSIDYGVYAARLGVFLVLPFGLALLFQSNRISHRTRSVTPLLPSASVFFLAFFAIGIMDGIGPLLVAEPLRVLGLLAACLACHVFFYFMGTVVAWWLGPRVALTAGMVSSYRNLALLYAIGSDFLPESFLVFVALWQIPMYVMPLFARPVISRLTGVWRDR